jgi:hypothetical protein
MEPANEEKHATLPRSTRREQRIIAIDAINNGNTKSDGC